MSLESLKHRKEMEGDKKVNRSQIVLDLELLRIIKLMHRLSLVKLIGFPRLRTAPKLVTLFLEPLHHII
jgi:hypothetical protein